MKRGIDILGSPAAAFLMRRKAGREEGCRHRKRIAPGLFGDRGTISGVVNDALPKLKTAIEAISATLEQGSYAQGDHKPVVINSLCADRAMSVNHGVLHPTEPGGLRCGGGGPSHGPFFMRDFCRTGLPGLINRLKEWHDYRSRPCHALEG